MTGHKGRVKILLTRDGDLCHYCRQPMDMGELIHDYSMTIEHIVPRSLGGSGAQYNMVLAHRFCNNGRGNLNQDHPGCSVCRYARYMHAISPPRELLSLGCTE